MSPALNTGEEIASEGAYADYPLIPEEQAFHDSCDPGAVGDFIPFQAPVVGPEFDIDDFFQTFVGY